MLCTGAGNSVNRLKRRLSESRQNSLGLLRSRTFVMSFRFHGTLVPSLTLRVLSSLQPPAPPRSCCFLSDDVLVFLSQRRLAHFL